ncbi:hypothetical protein JCM10213_006440 [Rhodosporidiobolus nylandii]
MLAASLLLVLSASASGLASASYASDALIAGDVQHLALAKRAESPSSSSYLQDVFGKSIPACQDVCDLGLSDYAACANLTTQATIAACACSSVTLGDLRSCASCISTHTSSSSNATDVVSAYNSFVDLCTQEGLAKVTGTVEVGASTQTLPRTSSTASPTDSTDTSRATYNPSSAPASTATVPALVASGAVASSARQAAASAEPTGATSGATSLVGSVVALSAVAVAGVAVLV